eukprot:scaffold6164_cov163-Amphora_coffeaeformis.AAC.16
MPVLFSRPDISKSNNRASSTNQQNHKLRSTTATSRPRDARQSHRRSRRWVQRTVIGAVTVLILGWNIYTVRTVLRYQDDGSSLVTTIATDDTTRHNSQEWKPQSSAQASSSSLPPPKQQPTHHACDGYKGIYHIAMTDELGGVGTAFFQLVVGQILYAERYALKPWIHFNNLSRVVYDERVHGQGPGVHFTMWQGGNATFVHKKHGRRREYTPGPPDATVVPRRKDFYFPGTGVWGHYMEPISDFVPGDRSCLNKTYSTMDLYLITPGIHGYDPDLATRCWRYDYLPPYITRPHLTYHEWWEPQRVRAHNVMQRYIRFRPYLHKAAERANPDCHGNNNNNDVWCLGLHIRHSDKAAGRQVLDVDSFRPYVHAFFKAGGQYVYVATDSATVWQEIQQTWPWKDRIRSLGDNVVRSTNQTAVFDITSSHHRTNQEVLTEILALSQCHFLIHGLSAVSETSIWINLDLHNRSVNLEPDNENEIMSPAEFGRLVALTMKGESDPDQLPQPARTHAWWNEILTKVQTAPPSCHSYNGTLIISDATARQADEPLVDEVFFESVLKQLSIAKKLHLLPTVLLDKRLIEYIFDENAHQTSNMVLTVIPGAWGEDGCPMLPPSTVNTQEVEILATNVWNTYILGKTCPGHRRYWFGAESISSTFSKCRWSIRGSESLHGNNLSWNEQLQASREVAHELVSKYMHFHPVLHSKANEVNPSTDSTPCLGALFRMTTPAKNKVSAEKYLPYLRVFTEISDGPIYVASDSSRPMQYMEKNFPREITQRFRSQGMRVARSVKAEIEIPLHMMDSHHRINSEMLVDILALSKCRVLIHSSNAMADAALYLNPYNLTSINLEDPKVPAPTHLEAILGESATSMRKKSTVISKDGQFITVHVSGTKVLSRNTGRSFSRHAIVYLAQKKHSTYRRDSFGTLLRSLELLRQNYLQQYMANADIFIFHVSSFDADDLATIEQVLGPDSVGAVRLVDLDQSTFWGRPNFLQNSNPQTWDAFPLFSEGYRHMIQFFAIHIWEFFTRLNEKIVRNAEATSTSKPTGYRYIMRLDEDSFLHSPIDYNIFEFMESQRYVYGYRMCSYEMQTAYRMWRRYQKFKGPEDVPKRDLALRGCGFYNNFFVADLEFFRQDDVQDFLQFIYQRGHIYVWRLGDLVIHTMTIYKFAQSFQVHRFLDFTYEHGTIDNTTGCLMWGGMQAGYRDVEAAKRLDKYHRERSKDGACVLNQTILTLEDLSPTYAHLPSDIKSVALQTVVAGNVEVIGKGNLSG